MRRGFFRQTVLPAFAAVITVILFITAFYGNLSAGEKNRRTALIYNGKTADADSARSLAAMAERHGFAAVYFSDAARLEKLFAGASMIVFGGTEDDLGPLIRSFTPKLRTALSEFIANGGVYIGICGGAYIASKGWKEESGFENALGIIPVETDNFDEVSDPQVIFVDWKNKRRGIFYQFGPKFIVPPGFACDITARYSGGSAAALCAKVGKGRVYLCGPHPEADETWIEDGVLRGESWSPTVDLADDMMKDAAAE